MDRIKETFTRMDLSGDGYIDKSELGGLLRELGQEPTKQDIVSVLFQIDTSKDGKISQEEFMAYYRKQNQVRFAI